MSAHELQHVIDALGRTLLHFLWQGVVIALVLEAWLAATKQRPSGERYLARCAGLLLLCAAPAWTFALLWLRGPVGADPILEAVASSAVAAEVTQTAQELGTLPLLVALWAVGVALFSLRLIGGCAELYRLRRRLIGAPLTPEWQARFDAAAHRFGTRAKALVVDSAVVAVPTVIGYVKPVVLLPARLFTGLTSDQLEALIAHELAHVARHDTLVNLAQSVVESLFFYHPAVWWISRGLRTEREFCCDDRAVVATQDGLSYARALAALEAWRGPQPQLGVSTLGGSLMQRIQRLVGTQPGRTAGASPRHALATLAALGALGATAFGFASWTAPEAAHDCECSCHGDAEARQPVRWRVLTTDDGGGELVEEVILDVQPGASGRQGGARGGGGGRAHGGGAGGDARAGGRGARLPGEYEALLTEAIGEDEIALEFLGGQTYRVGRTARAGGDVEGKLSELAQLEQQLAKLKVELGHLAQQRDPVQHESARSGGAHGAHGADVRRFLGSGTGRGVELHEYLGDVHESHGDTSGSHGAHGESSWIDAIIETEGHEGPRVFRVNPGAGGGGGVSIYGLGADGEDMGIGLDVKALREAIGKGGEIRIDLETLMKANGDIQWRTLVPGKLHSSGAQGGGAGIHTLRGQLGTGGGGRVHTTIIDGEGSIDVEVEELHEHLAGPHGHSGGHSGAHGQHGGSGEVHFGEEIRIDVQPEVDGTRRGMKLKLDETGGDSPFDGSRGNVFFKDSDGNGAFEGTSHNLFFTDSDGDGLPDQRVRLDVPHGGHGASGGGGGGGQLRTGRHFLRLHDQEGDNVVIEEVRGSERVGGLHTDGPGARGELIFDDHGVSVRKLEGGILTVETDSGESILLELRTTLDEESGQIEVEPLIERVEGKADASVAKPEKLRLRRSQRSPL